MDYEAFEGFINDNKGICSIVALGTFLCGVVIGYVIGKTYPKDYEDIKIEEEEIIKGLGEITEITIKRPKKFQDTKFKNGPFKSDIVDKILDESFR